MKVQFSEIYLKFMLLTNCYEIGSLFQLIFYLLIK